MTGPFSPLTTIPSHLFILHIAPRDELMMAYGFLVGSLKKTRVMYIRQNAFLTPLLTAETINRTGDLREIPSVIDLFSAIDLSPPSLLMIEYSPEWFSHDPDMIGPFVHLCRERARRSGSVLLMATHPDPILGEIETGVDKEILVMNVNPDGNEALVNENGGYGRKEHDMDTRPDPSVRYGQQQLCT